MIPITFVIPSYNNLRYLKNAYRSIRTYAGNDHEIIVLDDASTDDTISWLRKLNDDNLVIWENNTGKRLGHTITYNIGGNLAKNDIFSILHADMFIGPNYVENALKHLAKGVVVSATRIEPPLHPEGKEKIVKDFGLWPETFNEQQFLEFVKHEQMQSKDKITNGIFAPWFIHKEDFVSIGGHDPLFAPFPYEDSDIFQRFMLAGYTLKQSRDSLVYHLTCRGHKWTDDTVIGKVDNFFMEAEYKARRNYIRKWQSWIKNDEYHLPIIPTRYKTSAKIKGITTVEELSFLEIWFDELSIDSPSVRDAYVQQEQNNTSYDLLKKIKIFDDLTSMDVEVTFDVRLLDESDVSNIQNFSLLLTELKSEIETGETYELGNLQFSVKSLTNVVKDLTKVEETNE